VERIGLLSEKKERKKESEIKSLVMNTATLAGRKGLMLMELKWY
jgi:hypothetical protein